MNIQWFGLVFCLSGPLISQSVLQPVIVTATRLSISSADLREVEIISRREIEELAEGSVVSLFRHMGTVDLQRRNTGGAADFSLRGASFEQVLVLIDGVRINNPQTGHHNSEIPVALSDIERIEVLSGTASSLYGSEAFGGVIQIITRNDLSTGTDLSFRGGSFGTVDLGISHRWKTGPVHHRGSLEQARSDGYRSDTDYQNWLLSYQMRWHRDDWTLSARAGGQFKDFGAGGFYADYPSREKTSSWNAAVELRGNRGKKPPWVFRWHGRRHHDDFILDKNDPEWFRTNHSTTIWGGEWQSEFRTLWGRAVLGTDVLGENLQSTQLGNRHRSRAALYGETEMVPASAIRVNSGIRWDWNDSWGHQFNPTLNMRFGSASLYGRLSAGRAFRAPTFTELYYQSPANQGDPDLQPECAWSFETGTGYQIRGLHAEAALFYRRETNKIDWIRSDASMPWQVTNSGLIHVRGISAGIRGSLNTRWNLAVHYIFLDRLENSPIDAQSKYGAGIWRHHLTCRGNLVWSKRIQQNWLIQGKSRQKQAVNWILDTRIIFRLNSSLRFYMELNNCLDVIIEEIPGVPMPGRSLMSGVTFGR
ncbi:MAG TPA: TonB-dependent receptor [bacterium]|nr:TonB-dependent receptor [bacterium]